MAGRHGVNPGAHVGLRWVGGLALGVLLGLLTLSLMPVVGVVFVIGDAGRDWRIDRPQGQGSWSHGLSIGRPPALVGCFSLV